MTLIDSLAVSPRRPLVMGILNVTPDSFSDGGDHLSPDHAVQRAAQMIDEGADIIDVGPESTRPGSQPVSADEQIARAVPVIQRIRERHPSIAISIDTCLASVAHAAIDAGANMINDTAALRDDDAMVSVAAASKATVVLMHRRGTPATMQAGGGPHYDDVMSEIRNFFNERMAFAESNGVDRDRIIIDPGLGFGKRSEDNLRIMHHLDELVAIGRPVLIGASRKKFLDTKHESQAPQTRLHASLACAVLAASAGAAILRVHDVRPTVDAMRLHAAVRNADRSEP